MTSFLMISSLVLGLISWILPVINLMQYKNNGHKNWGIISALSLIACAISLYFQILDNYHLVKIGDMSSVMDTTGASTLLSAILLIITIILNLIMLVIYRDKTGR